MAPTVRDSGGPYDAEISGGGAEVTGIPPPFVLDVVGVVIIALTAVLTGVLLPDGGDLVVVEGPA